MRDLADQELARLLVRMELSPKEKMRLLLDPSERTRHMLPADARDILGNPYLITERFIPDKDEDPVSFLTVDHALVPHESMAESPVRVLPRDPRRLRALLAETLADRAADGDTFAAAAEVLASAIQRSPEDRPCDVPIDRLSHQKVAPILDELIERFELERRRAASIAPDPRI